MAMPHRIEDETIATEAVDTGTLVAENSALAIDYCAHWPMRKTHDGGRSASPKTSVNTRSRNSRASY
jgi:hypothetical protein